MKVSDSAMSYFKKEKNESPFVSVNTLIQPKEKEKNPTSIPPFIRERLIEQGILLLHDKDSLANDLDSQKEVPSQMNSEDSCPSPTGNILEQQDFVDNMAGISNTVEKSKELREKLLLDNMQRRFDGSLTKKDQTLSGETFSDDFIKDDEENKETKTGKERPTLKAYKGDDYQLEVRRLLTLDMPYKQEGFDYSWWVKKKEDIIESGTADMMTSSLKGGSLLSEFIIFLGWELMDSLAEQDISSSKKKLINQAIYEWNIRVNNNHITIMDFKMSADNIDKINASLANSVNIFTEGVINTVLGAIDNAAFLGIPVTSTLLSPELPKYKEGDAMLKMTVLYKYDDFSTQNNTLTFGSFGQGQSWIDKLTGSTPRESIRNYYVMTIELHLRNSKIIDASWTLTEYYYNKLHREFVSFRETQIR